MAIDSYPNLVANLINASREEELYMDFVEKATRYFGDRARLVDARCRGDPSLIQFEIDVEGRYRDLRGSILEINSKLKGHIPPLPLLPTEQEGIDTLVSEVLNDLFNNRSR